MGSYDLFMARRRAPSPKKSLGQYFLRDEAVLREIATSVRQPKGSRVVEVGPGTGQLTEALLDAGFQVTAVERDRRMMHHLAQRFHGHPRLTAVEGDIRDIDIGELVEAGEPFAVAGNLPYFIASPIVRHFLEQVCKPEELVVMVQREVAREMAAKPGKFSMLSVGIQTFGEPSVLFDVPPSAFDPQPKVVSSVVRITPHRSPLVEAGRQEMFFKVVRGAFRHSRKHVHNSILRGTPYEPQAISEALAAAGVEHERRPETLTIPEWLAVVGALTDSR